MAIITIEDLDIESMVQEWIDNTDILEHVDVESMVDKALEDTDLLEDIDLDAKVEARVEELVDEVEFHSYKSLRKEFVSFSDEVKGLREDNAKLWNSIRVIDEDIQLIRKAFFMIKSKVEKRPWYKFW